MTHWQESCVSHIFLLLMMVSYLFQILINQDTSMQTAFGGWGEAASRFIGTASVLTS